jgi:hypothetical protein
VTRTLLLATAALALTSTGPAGAAPAQPAPASGQASRTTVYEAAFFAQYAPRTALDIVQRVPGFSLDLGATQTQQGSVDVRGFAGTAGNVVINGARPSTKAETLDITLARIPAQQVIRVELGPGDLFGSDYAGKSQVLNVVLSQQSGIDGNVQVAARRWSTGYINSDIQASALIRRGASTINLSAGTGRNRQLQDGPDIVTDVIGGALIERRFKHNSYFNKNPFLSASWGLEHGASDAFHLNARWAPSRFDLTQDNRVTPTVGSPHDDNLFQHYSDPVIELGGDVTRPLAGGAVKLVALATRRKRNDMDAYVGRSGLLTANAPVNGGFEQTVKARRNETIGRVSWTRPNLLGFSFELGAEGALNTLADDVNFGELDNSGVLVPIDLPIAHAIVNEQRGEVYVNVGKTLAPALRVDGGLNYEFSRLKVRGDAIADRSLKFLKPTLSVDWKPGGAWHAQLSVRRTVAQLDFYDFISVADLSISHVSGGNAQLQPQRTWEFRLTADHPLLGDGSVKIELGHDLVSKLQDRVLIFDEHGNGFDSPGNLGTGRRYYAALTIDAPLNHLWAGLRTKFTATLQRTQVDDPITGKLRKFSGYYPDWQWELDVRRDRGPLSFGFSFNDGQRWTNYRTDEFDTNFNGSVYATAFVEYRPSASTAITFDVDNVLNTTSNLDRLIFRPNRAAPIQIVNEYRQRNNHLDIGLTLKHSFGGSSGTAVASQGK